MSENLTTRGICYNLKKTPYTLIVNYENIDLEYKFSSQLYKDKFLSKLGSNRDNINSSLSKRFGFTIVNNLLCDIKLYSMTEKRGFLIMTNDEKAIECLSTIRLDGKNLI